MLEPSGLELDLKPRRTTPGYSLDPMVEVVNEKRDFYPSQRERKTDISHAEWEKRMIKARYTAVASIAVGALAGVLGTPLTACVALGSVFAVGFWVCTEVS